MSCFILEQVHRGQADLWHLQGYSTASEELDSARALSLSIYDRLASLDQQLAALEVEEEELARTEKALEEALGEKVPS